MPNKNQDNPDDYEAIFENEPASTRTPNNDLSEDYQDKFIDIDDSIKHKDSVVDSVHTVDSDIDDGIFAPERRVKPARKNSSLLLGTVSLFAIIAVGGFLYISNPDIFSKVSQNLETANGTIVNPEVLIPPSDSVQNETASVPLPQQEDATLTTPSADVPSPQVDTTVGVVTPPPSVENNIVISENQNVTIPEQNVVTPVVDDQSKIDEGIQPIQAAPDLPVANVDTVTDKVAAPTTSETPLVEVVEEIKEVDKGETKTNSEKPVIEKTASEKVESAPAPVIVASKEEKKALADAKLDKYFDSPNGRMLKDIPAPSMDPKKGNRESIIIVNKGKQQRNVERYTEPQNIEIETTSLGAKSISANRALKLGRLDAAKEMYEELYRLSPKDGQVLMGRALVFQKMGQTEQAISTYEELLNVYPDNADAIVNLAGLVRKQYPAVALNKLLDLSQRFPNNPIILGQLGVTYADSGNYEDALRTLKSAISIDGTNARHYFNVAVILEKSGNARQAVSYYEKALEVDAIHSKDKQTISREKIYDRLAKIRGN